MHFSVNHILAGIQTIILFYIYLNFDPSQLSSEVQNCGFISCSGEACPSCGNTRSLISFFNCQFLQSLRFNPVGFFLSLVFTVDFFGRIAYLFGIFEMSRKYYFKLLFLFLTGVMCFSIIRWYML